MLLGEGCTVACNRRPLPILLARISDGRDSSGQRAIFLPWVENDISSKSGCHQRFICSAAKSEAEIVVQLLWGQAPVIGVFNRAEFLDRESNHQPSASVGKLPALTLEGYRRSDHRLYDRL